MQELSKVETIIKSNAKYELVKINKVYQFGRSERIEIRDKDGDYCRGFAGTPVEDVIEIFNNHYDK